MGHTQLYCSEHYWELLSSWSRPSSVSPSWPPPPSPPPRLTPRPTRSTGWRRTHTSLPLFTTSCLSARSSPKLWWSASSVTPSPSAPPLPWWSVRKSPDTRTQSVRRSRFPLSLTDTTVLLDTSARERLMPSLSTASPTAPPSPWPTLSRPSTAPLVPPSSRTSPTTSPPACPSRCALM